MSAIYGDPTLGANLKFVILRLIFYEGGVAADEEGEGVGQTHMDNLRYIVLLGLNEVTEPAVPVVRGQISTTTDEI
jgi:hypothetical protein